MKTPQVRYLDIQQYGDKFLIVDPLGITEPMLVSPQLLLVMSLLDGSRDDREVRAEILKRTGLILTQEEYKKIIELLDRNYLLLNDRFYSKLSSIKEDMLRKGIKKAFHAGQAYPSDPNKLKSFLRSSLIETEKENLIGILVPHMDMRVAVQTYGRVYSRVFGSPKKVLILGVSHYIHRSPFSVCPLDLETPLGILKTDKKAIERLRTLFNYDIFDDVLSYQKEHSIEFQAVFVKYLFPEALVIPAIVSYGEEELLREVASKLASVLEGENLLVVSSVDMSHVGKKFGDSASYDPSSRDEEYIALLAELDSSGSFNLLKKDNNRTRIDGQFTNFVFLELLKLLGSRKGKKIDYQVYYEEATDSIVTYAGMTFS